MTGVQNDFVSLNSNSMGFTCGEGPDDPSGTS